MLKYILILYSLVSIVVFTQSDPQLIHPTNDALNHRTGEIISINNNEFIALYSKYNGFGGVQFCLVRSTNGGSAWSAPTVIFDTIAPSAFEDSLASPYLIRGANNRLITFFRVGNNGTYKYKISDDGGITWGVNRILTLINNPVMEGTLKITSAIHTGGNEIVLAISQYQNSIGFAKSSDNGLTFSLYQGLTAGGLSNPTLLPMGNGDMIMACQEKNQNNTKLMLLKYSAATTGWHDTTVIISGSETIRNPKLYKTSDGAIHLFYRRIRSTIGGFLNSNYFRITTTDNGVTWGTPVQITRYAGQDANLNINPQSSLPIVIFSSSRYSFGLQNRLWWGNGLTLTDQEAPPVIFSTKMIPEVPVQGDSVFVRVYAGFSGGNLSGVIKGDLNEVPVEYPLYDDGLHNDSVAGDGIFRGFVKIATPGDFANLYVLMNGGGQYLSSAQFTYSLLIAGITTEDGFWTGRIWVPFQRNGIIADVDLMGRSGLYYDSIYTVFSNGFALSGLINDVPWSASMMSASRIADYVAGPVGSSVIDPKNGIYRVALQDSAFGASWELWKYAVMTGARYWDGNHNGIYDPIDLNHNGIWDPSEDMPEILGEISYYCVYNDGMSTELRRFQEVPVGIEIRQTIYAYPNSAVEAMRDAVFIRYEIVNKGNVASDISDVFFSAWTDTDMGEYNDDLYGTDSVRNSSYIWNEGSDPIFGINPPAVFQTIVFGQPVFIRGLSYQDLNGNGVYDPGTDIANDTATVPMGKPFQNKKIQGASNLGLTSSQHYMSSHPTHGDPRLTQELRNYQQGRNTGGAMVDPCTWPYGHFYGGVPCSPVSKIFMYSGDPVTNTGWLNDTPVDQRSFANSGPFQLTSGDTVTFHNAIIIGRGTDHLNSITVTRTKIDEIFAHLGAKYHYYPTGLKEVEGIVPDEFQLWQNYPNPFNPETVIKFSLRERANVSLSVYNITGQKVTTLINGEMERGLYEQKFDGTKFSSGVYIFRLEAVSSSSSFSATVKAVLLK